MDHVSGITCPDRKGAVQTVINMNRHGVVGKPFKRIKFPCPYGRAVVRTGITRGLRLKNPFQLAAQGFNLLAGLVDIAVDRLIAFDAIGDQF